MPVPYCEPISNSLYWYQRVPAVTVSTFGMMSKSTEPNTAHWL